MADFDDAAALVAYKDWTTTVNTLWTIFSAAAVGFSGVATKVPPVDGFWSLRVALTGGWVVFALGNAYALGHAQKLVHTLSTALVNRPSTSAQQGDVYRHVFKAASASHPMAIIGFQLILTAFIAFIVYLVPSGT